MFCAPNKGFKVISFFNQFSIKSLEGVSLQHQFCKINTKKLHFLMKKAILLVDERGKLVLEFKV